MFRIMNFLHLGWQPTEGPGLEKRVLEEEEGRLRSSQMQAVKMQYILRDLVEALASRAMNGSG